MPRYDSEEKLLDPWNEENIKLFLSKAKCFVDQYSSYFDQSSDMNVCQSHSFKTFIAISLIKHHFLLGWYIRRSIASDVSDGQTLNYSNRTEPEN